MKKEIDIDKYNELCDRIRSVTLFAEAFKKRNLSRRMVSQELMEMIRKDAIEVVQRVQSLEKLANGLCNIKKEDDS